MEDNKHNREEVISFDLPEYQHAALQTLAANRKVRLSGEVRDGRFVVDNLAFANEGFTKPLFVAVNAPFRETAAAA